MKPGTSARYSSGRPYASQSPMKRAALSAESTNSTPPFTFDWLASTPTGRPSMRANPVRISPAHSRFSSHQELASTRRSRTSRTSKGLFSSFGITDSRSAGSFSGGCAAIRGSASPARIGREESTWRAAAIASASSFASQSPSPDTLQCMRAPPISSRVVVCPITISAMRGEPRYMLALPSTMNSTSQNAGMYAPPAAEGPNSRQSWGTKPDIRHWLAKIRPAPRRPGNIWIWSVMRAPAESTR